MIVILHRISDLLFPPKCILCRRLLTEGQIDLCGDCREKAPSFTKEKINFSFVARWTAVWYYKDTVRDSLLRYKFYGRRNYAVAYGRLLAMRILQKFPEGFDVLTWVPVDRFRRLRRGFDHMELIARAVGKELDCVPRKLLKKVRHTPAQSSLKDASHRKANILNAYRITDPELIRGKRILLLDDIITTGATISECSKTLMAAGAKEVYCAAVAAASHDKKQVKQR